MRKVNRIVLHATSGWNDQTTKSIKDYWKNTLGWKSVGYHKLINNDGTIENLAPLSAITNGVQGFNSDSVHICYKGGLVSTSKNSKGKVVYEYGDTRTKAQKDGFLQAIKEVFEELKKYQDVDDIIILGHRDLSPDLNGDGKIESREWVKVCPTFNASDFEEYGWLMGTKALKRFKKGRKYW